MTNAIIIFLLFIAVLFGSLFILFVGIIHITYRILILRISKKKGKTSNHLPVFSFQVNLMKKRLMSTEIELCDVQDYIFPNQILFIENDWERIPVYVAEARYVSDKKSILRVFGLDKEVATHPSVITNDFYRTIQKEEVINLNYPIVSKCTISTVLICLLLSFMGIGYLCFGCYQLWISGMDDFIYIFGSFAVGCLLTRVFGYSFLVSSTHQLIIRDENSIELHHLFKKRVFSSSDVHSVQSYSRELESQEQFTLFYQQEFLCKVNEKDLNFKQVKQFLTQNENLNSVRNYLTTLQEEQIYVPLYHGKVSCVFKENLHDYAYQIYGSKQMVQEYYPFEWNEIRAMYFLDYLKEFHPFDKVQHVIIIFSREDTLDIDQKCEQLFYKISEKTE